MLPLLWLKLFRLLGLLRLIRVHNLLKSFEELAVLRILRLLAPLYFRLSRIFFGSLLELVLKLFAVPALLGLGEL